ncbi:MAG: hypothetical protein IJW03_00520 [Clostridia bacterium]|nr:hypothetical protein [Clostridia bacterium]
MITFGATLGIIIAIRNAKTLVRYGSTRLTEGEVVYLASVFKSDYIASLVKSGVKGVRDSESFWASESSTEGKSWGDMLNEAFVQYVSGIAVKNSLYLNSAKFGKNEKNYVKDKVDERLMYLGYDSEKSFNELSGELLFDYDDLINGSRLLCKADASFEVIYGEDGAGLAAYADECEKYLATYAHVALIFLRTEDVYELDDDGNVQYDDDGSILTRPLTSEERASRTETAEKLREYIENYNNSEDNAITPETFELYMREKSDTDPDMFSRGYYFHENAAVTVQFAEVYPEVVEAAFDMKIGEYREVSCLDSVCFIYRYGVAEGAYADTENVFLSDFYIDGAQYSFTESIKALSSEVVFSEKFYGIDIVKIPANSSFVVNNWS